MSRDDRSTSLLLLLVLAGAVSSGQTTQGLIAGRIVDSGSGRPLLGAVISFQSPATNTSGSIRTGSSGFYVIALLPPGQYRLRITADQYQPQELHQLDLPVAARLDLNFRLRPLSDVWEAGQYRSFFLPDREAVLTFFGPDVDASRSGSFEAVRHLETPLESTVSDAIDPELIRNLPLAGRDVYSMLAVLPGVTSDTGTGRGLGLSVNGQRPVASNFLLDGVENDNYLVTGPLASLPPEAIQEYRVSTSSWSAEFGGTAGFVANAVTRAGGGEWHGNSYFNLKNDALNANTFENNFHDWNRSPLKEAQYGFQSGGPVWKQLVFVSASLDIFRSRSYRPPVDIRVPSPKFVNALTPTNPGRLLLTEFPTPATEFGDGVVSNLTVRPTVSLNRKVGLVRADYVSGASRAMVRMALNRNDWPDFIWYPYPDFTSGLTQPLDSLAVAYSGGIRPNITHELRAGWGRNTTRWNRPHPEIPTLAIASTLQGPNHQVTDLQSVTLLPGSPALYGLRDTNRSFAIDDNWLWSRKRHIFKAGGGILFRSIDGLMSTGQAGRFSFKNILDFGVDEPETFTAAIDRRSLAEPQWKQPAYDRSYRNNQYFLFLEDSWRAGSRLVFNAGIRYENFGVPLNTGMTKDAVVQLGSGSSFPQRLATASVSFPPAGTQKLWAGDNKNFAPRLGFAWDGTNRHAPVIRGSYGLFFDRPFDNLWENVRNNNLVVPTGLPCAPQNSARNVCTPAAIGNPLGYLAPVSEVLSVFRGADFTGDFPSLTLIDPGLRASYVQSYFVGLQERISESWDVELNALGALGRRLVTTDVVNRAFSTPQGDRYNSNLFDISWRSNQGGSDYTALAAVARYRSRSGFFQLSYTWSHSLDTQSDPLTGDFFNLSFVNFTSRARPATQAAFTRQFDSSADRASSDFDQRHNLVFFSWWDLPVLHRKGLLSTLTRDWRFAQMAAVRTGFPFSVLAPSTGAIFNQRADLVNPAEIRAPAGAPASGGAVALLNKDAFVSPPDGVLGNTGRNAFRGPGLWSLDLSISRSFRLGFFGASGRLTLRSDFFNAINHANLNNPDSLLSSPTFGQAFYGRMGYETGFPSLVPFNETARQIQLLMKVEF